MAAPQYSSDDYLRALQALMPRGAVWPRDPGSLQTKVLTGLTKSYEVQNARANNLLVDAFPTSAVELLPEWEATLGLPSPAVGPTPSMLARRTLVVARFVGAGGQSIPCFTRYAALLGFDVTIQAHAPFRCGQSRCGQPLGAPEQMYALTISTPGATASSFGDYGPAVLQNELQRIAAPFSVLNFLFT